MQSFPDAEDIEIHLLLEGIHARYGYDFRDYAKGSIRRRIQNALRKSGLNDLGALQHAVLTDAEMFGYLLNHLTVQVSEMFRDPELYRVFRDEVLPHLRPYPQIKIWHAGCAEGEEAYSTAILLTEAALYERAEIYATDLSATALERAAEGVYRWDRVETFTDNYLASGGTGQLDQYYSRGYGRISMRDGLRSNVFFFQHNLAHDHTFGEMQVIFCRNVLIYFNPALRDRVTMKLTGALCHGGFLVLGRGERLSQETLANGFEPFCAEARIYRYWGNVHGAAS